MRLEVGLYPELPSRDLARLTKVGILLYIRVESILDFSPTWCAQSDFPSPNQFLFLFLVLPTIKLRTSRVLGTVPLSYILNPKPLSLRP